MTLFDLLLLTHKLSRSRKTFHTYFQAMVAQVPRVFKCKPGFEITMRMRLIADGWRAANGDGFLTSHDRTAILALVNEPAATEYVLIPMTLDYDTPITHQGALLIKPGTRKCIVYEGYGTYAKYGYSYWPQIVQLCREFKCIAQPYHSWYLPVIPARLATSDKIGIQTLLLIGNNNIRNMFENAEAIVLQHISKTVKRASARRIDTTNADYTASAMDLADAILAERNTPIADKLAACILAFSSQLCVIIMITEMAYFARNRIDELYRDIVRYQFRSVGLLRKFQELKITPN